MATAIITARGGQSFEAEADSESTDDDSIDEEQSETDKSVAKSADKPESTEEELAVDETSDAANIAEDDKAKTKLGSEGKES